MKTRLARDEDMESIYMMGFDVWGNNSTKEKYLSSCANSEKYKLGSWYCIEKNNELISSIIIYRCTLGLADKYCGFGSISTAPIHRNQGYAGILISQSIKSLEQNNCLGIFLFSEIGKSFYDKFGFCQVSGYGKEGLMFLSVNGGSQPAAPSYF